MRLVNCVILLYCLNIAGSFSGNVCFGQATGPKPAAMPHAFIYKMKQDYSRYVPVILSEDKQEVVAYPDPTDLAAVDMQPVKLRNNYWLDRRGIGPHVAFLKLTYKQYAALDKAPSPDELKGMILDDHPLKEWCDCGSRYQYKNIKQELNTLISSGKIRKHCKVLR